MPDKKQRPCPQAELSQGDQPEYRNNRRPRPGSVLETDRMIATWPTNQRRLPANTTGITVTKAVAASGRRVQKYDRRPDGTHQQAEQLQNS